MQAFEVTVNYVGILPSVLENHMEKKREMEQKLGLCRGLELSRILGSLYSSGRNRFYRSQVDLLHCRSHHTRIWV